MVGEVKRRPLVNWRWNGRTLGFHLRRWFWQLPANDGARPCWSTWGRA